MQTTSTFDEALKGTDAVFITCLIPTYKGPTGVLAKEMEYEQGYEEIIRPTVDGCIGILKSAYKQGVRQAVICSSTSSTNPVPAVTIKNEMIASKCGWTPFNNYKVKGFPVGTIVNGHLVMSDGKVIVESKGTPLKF